MAAGSNVCRTFTIQVDAIGQFFWRVESYLTISGSQRPEILPANGPHAPLPKESVQCAAYGSRSHSRWWQIKQRAVDYAGRSAFRDIEEARVAARLDGHKFVA